MSLRVLSPFLNIAGSIRRIVRIVRTKLMRLIDCNKRLDRINRIVHNSRNWTQLLIVRERHRVMIVTHNRKMLL